MAKILDPIKDSELIAQKTAHQETFGKQLKKLLNKTNLSYRKFAKELGLNRPNTVGNWANGISQPEWIYLRQIIRFFYLHQETKGFEPMLWFFDDLEIQSIISQIKHDCQTQLVDKEKTISKYIKEVEEIQKKHDKEKPNIALQHQETRQGQWKEKYEKLQRELESEKKKLKLEYDQKFELYHLQRNSKNEEFLANLDKKYDNKIEKRIKELNEEIERIKATWAKIYAGTNKLMGESIYLKLIDKITSFEFDKTTDEDYSDFAIDIGDEFIKLILSTQGYRP